MSLNKELLDILSCPSCKEKVALLEDESGLICEKCKVVFPVKDEIPVMIMAEAVESEKWQAGKKK
ncbi:MAG: Trm112 family protein [Desulfovibrio sp.]